MRASSHPCDRLLSDAVAAFERIASGQPANCAKEVTDALIKYDLIRPTVQVVGRDSLGLVLRHGHSLLPDVEKQWKFLRGDGAERGLYRPGCST